MGVYYAVIGVIEGAVTVVVIQLIMHVRPDMVDFAKPVAKGADAG
jgi:ABC-type Co2+ transport system permease subunit